MSVGYVLSGPDNDSYMLRGPGSAPVCSSCGLLTDATWVDPDFELVDDRFDVSYTYDGYLIVSERFRAIAEGPGTQFIELAGVRAFYSLVADDVVPFDAARRKTRFEQLCVECGRYFVVAGATPAYLRIEANLPDQLFRTDIEFGTGNEQSPLIIVGSGMANRLLAGNLVGLDLAPVRD
jgi:hypothetical protein